MGNPKSGVVVISKYELIFCLIICMILGYNLHSTSIAIKQEVETGEINKMEVTPLLILRALPRDLGVGLESGRTMDDEGPQT